MKFKKILPALAALGLASASALTSTASASAAPFNTPRSNWVKTYDRTVTCFWNEVPFKCDVYYNQKEVTWKVWWGGKLGTIRYYARRGGNWFQETYDNGAQVAVWELHPKSQLLVNKEGDSIKIFDLR